MNASLDDEVMPEDANGLTWFKKREKKEKHDVKCKCGEAATHNLIRGSELWGPVCKDHKLLYMEAKGRVWRAIPGFRLERIPDNLKPPARLGLQKFDHDGMLEYSREAAKRREAVTFERRGSVGNYHYTVKGLKSQRRKKE